jgi:MFS family permease
VLANATLYLGLAFATDLWQVVLVVFVERALGWPMFLASSNAMTADLVRLERRPEAYGVLRTAIMAGVVAGPALAGIALGAGVGLSRVFLIAGVGCLGFLVPLLLLLRETRPGIAGDDAPDGREAVAGVETAARGEADGDTGGAGGGYRDVLRDRRFLAFCAVALLPLFCLGQLYSTFPVMVTGEMGLPASSWGLLVSAYALLVASMQLPIVRVTRRRDAMLRLSVASACFGVGLGGAAFAAPGWQLVGLLGVLAVGEVLFSPVSSTVVTGLAPPALRGRYLGAWTLVWMFGLSLGPTAGGLLMDVLGGRGLFGLVLVAGAFGAAAFPLLRRQGRSRVAPSFRHARRG